MLTEPLSPMRHAALLAFMDRPDQSFCFCRFWYFAGDSEAWLACDSSANRAALARDLDADNVWGAVAVEGSEIVGWLRLARSAEVPKLGDPTPDAASVLCMSVAVERRSEGVARALLRAAIDAARAAGCVELRAYPRIGEGLDAGAVWTGPAALYASEGFVEVGRGERRLTCALALTR